MKPEDVTKDYIISFFEWCGSLDHLVTRPLDHIRPNWELTWDHDNHKYIEEEDSYASLFNELILELSETDPPKKYHDNEDCLAENVITELGWNIKKEKGRWVGGDYDSILEQGSFSDAQQKNLVLAVAGRIRAAIIRDQFHFDDMESSHQKMLSRVLSIILFHRTNYE